MQHGKRKVRIRSRVRSAYQMGLMGGAAPKFVLVGLRSEPELFKCQYSRDYRQRFVDAGALSARTGEEFSLTQQSMSSLGLRGKISIQHTQWISDFSAL